MSKLKKWTYKNIEFEQMELKGIKVDYIKTIDDLREYVEENGYAQGDLEGQEDWFCSICGKGLENNEPMHVYDAGWQREGYVCEGCWEKAFSGKRSEHDA